MDCILTLGLGQPLTWIGLLILTLVSRASLAGDKGAVRRLGCPLRYRRAQRTDQQDSQQPVPLDAPQVETTHALSL
ncbi:hypothetical protein ACK1CN_22035 [Vibrio coralliilyticus]|uniref:hypothetical protein n=1 Tax=Vibrio TaxID=662 RepID=UPI001F51B09A|nr:MULTISPECIES: hypothetical protein [Vibrio]WFB51157.1 hypothetical protein P6988_25175 [Vibrio coralliilyticus]